ncbi:acyltransferase family protein [Blastomonas sp. SL216]|uniref:acyltransferase family protein n=1 Tax=Blastomonas sp. SL216 TaxID=2995169 RepID=UPI002377B0F2|nr:acyltransferase [Blastomonas sp. SL216]
MEHRKEIDGLRALAVVPVILYHAGFDLFKGGFVGVDIFFVISGYLITSILVDDLKHRKFSLLNFYERRARRILPALYFMILCTSVFATIIMLPSQLKDFGQSVVASVGLVPNVYFYLKTDYWSQSAEFLPLVHLWSIGVEEQFYLLFPLLLALIWRFGRDRILAPIIVLAIASLCLSEWGWRHDAAANFYLAPTRAWELLAGSIAALIVQKRGVQNSEALSMVGLGAIVIAVLAYEPTTPFPSLYALVPVVGTSLLILFAGKETWAARLMSARPLVLIGLISYSAYLWHQPLLALFRVSNASVDMAVTTKLLIVFATFIIAYFSHGFVEQPFRTAGKIRKPRLILLMALPFFVLGTFGLAMHFTNGLNAIKMALMPPATRDLVEKLEVQRTARDGVWKRELAFARDDWPQDGKLRMLFLGDSLSADLYVVARRSSRIAALADVRQMPLDDNCARHLATRGNELNHDGRLCALAVPETLQSDLFARAEVIVLAQAWLSNAEFLDTLLGRPEFRQKRVIVYKTHAFAPADSLILSLNGDDQSFSESGFAEFVYLNKHGRTVMANAVLESTAQKLRIPTIEGFDAFCLERKKQCALFSARGEPYIIDQSHLSVAGIARFEPWLARRLDEVLTREGAERAP